MSDIFHDTSEITYPVIDADSHVHEPPDLWETRVPSKWRARAPRIEHAAEGDVWLFDNGKKKWPIGLTATAGKSQFDYQPFGGRYETMRPGAFEMKARLGDMDADGIYVQVLYPSVTLTGAGIYGDEPELQRVCVRAYNEWLRDLCAPSGGRLIAQALMPTTGVDDCLKELKWALQNGHRGVIISSFPNGSIDPKPEDDRFWAAVTEADIPIAIHTGSFMREELTADDPNWWSSYAMLAKGATMRGGGETVPVVCTLLFSRITDRFPNIKFLLVESNIGWIPSLMEQTDEMFRELRWMVGAGTEMKRMPSEIFRRNFWGTFIIDNIGIELRHRMNIDHLMWSTDYPHSASYWPDSSRTIERNFRGVPKADVKKMLHDNCKALYKLDVPSVKP